MLALGGKAADEQAGYHLAEQALLSGQAWERFRALVKAQQGDVRYVGPARAAAFSAAVRDCARARAGWLATIHAREIGETAVDMGAGRARKEDPIDHAVGIVIHHKVGDRVENGQPLFTLHARTPESLAAARERLLRAHGWSETKVEPLPLFYGVIR